MQFTWWIAAHKTVPMFSSAQLSHTTWLLPRFLGSWHDGLFTPAKVQLIASLTFTLMEHSVRGSVCMHSGYTSVLRTLHMQCFFIRNSTNKRVHHTFLVIFGVTDACMCSCTCTFGKVEVLRCNPFPLQELLFIAD